MCSGLRCYGCFFFKTPQWLWYLNTVKLKYNKQSWSKDSILNCKNRLLLICPVNSCLSWDQKKLWKKDCPSETEDSENTIRKLNYKDNCHKVLQLIFMFLIYVLLGALRQWKTSVFTAEMVIIMDIHFIA